MDCGMMCEGAVMTETVGADKKKEKCQNNTNVKMQKLERKGLISREGFYILLTFTKTLEFNIHKETLYPNVSSLRYMYLPLTQNNKTNSNLERRGWSGCKLC